MAETEFIEFNLYAGDLTGLNPTPRRMIAALTERDIDLAPDGTFEIRLDARGGRNAMQMEPDINSISVRRYLRDPLVDRPRPLAIRRTTPAPPKAPLTAQAVERGTTEAIAFARNNVRMWSQWADHTRATKRNVITPMADGGDIHTPVGHVYLNGAWVLGPGEALALAFVPDPNCYWSLVPTSYWMESLEWRFGERVFATSFDTRPDADGVVRLVLGPTDPRLPGHTWLSTEGRAEGLVSLRVARNSGPWPVVETKVVPTP
jgi:hypothetical protein